MTSAHERPFRFGVCLFSPTSRAGWVAAARRAEDLGFDVVSVADHLHGPAPVPALVLAAEATERVLVGTYVLNTSLQSAAALEREIATLARVCDGRVEIGLGAGYVRAEFDAAGIPWPSAGDRAARLDDVVSRVPAGTRTLVAGRGDRVLRLAAARADVVSFTGTHVRRDGDGPTLAGPEVLDERSAFVRGLNPDVELNITVQRVVTGSARDVTDVWGNPLDLPPSELAELPSVLVGSPRECADRLRERRERFGLSYLTVLEPAVEQFAEVITHLR